MFSDKSNRLQDKADSCVLEQESKRLKEENDILRKFEEFVSKESRALSVDSQTQTRNSCQTMCRQLNLSKQWDDEWRKRRSSHTKPRYAYLKEQIQRIDDDHQCRHSSPLCPAALR